MTFDEGINLLHKLENYFPKHEAIQAVTYLKDLQHKLNNDEYSRLLNNLLSGNIADIEQLINSKLYSSEQLDMDPAELRVDPYRAGLDHNILQYRKGFNSDLNRAKEAFINAINAIKVKDSPTGIHNPADYLPAMRVGDAYEKQTTYVDEDGDGDVDKIEVEEKA